MSPVDVIVAALMAIIEAIGPGGLLVVGAAVLMLQVTDVLGDALDDRRDRAAEHRAAGE